MGRVKPLSQQEAATLYFLPLKYMLEKYGREPIVVEVQRYIIDRGAFALHMVDESTDETYIESIYQYNNTWRLWNKRPTAKDMENAKWAKER